MLITSNYYLRLKEQSIKPKSHLLLGLAVRFVAAAQVGAIYWLGFAAVAVVLFWEHRIVSPNDLSRINRAFFDYNAYVSIGYFLATLADSILRSSAGTVG